VVLGAAIGAIEVAREPSGVRCFHRMVNARSTAATARRRRTHTQYARHRLEGAGVELERAWLYQGERTLETTDPDVWAWVNVREPAFTQVAYDDFRSCATIWRDIRGLRASSIPCSTPRNWGRSIGLNDARVANVPPDCRARSGNRRMRRGKCGLPAHHHCPKHQGRGLQAFVHLDIATRVQFHSGALQADAARMGMRRRRPSRSLRRPCVHHPVVSSRTPTWFPERPSMRRSQPRAPRRCILRKIARLRRRRPDPPGA